MELASVSSAELARLCVDKGDAQAWLEFIRRYQRPIALTVLRMCRLRRDEGTGQIDDLIQEIYLRLCANGCKLLREFVPLPGSEDPFCSDEDLSIHIRPMYGC